MRKYLGIVRVERESMAGLDIRIYTKFSGRKSYIEKWFKLYPDCEKILLENTPELEAVFRDFDDFRFVTKAEEREAQKLLEKFNKEPD